MNKKRAIQILLECARQYDTNLCGKNLLFVYGNPENPSILSASFYGKHFLHLTGIATRMNANLFYSACLNRLLSEKDFEFKSNGTTEQKLTVLPYLFSIHRSARLLANFGGNNVTLSTEKVIGNHTATLGLVSVGDYYVPNTVLQGDVRTFGEVPFYDVLAVLRRNIRGPKEFEVFGLMRGTDEDDLIARLTAKNIIIKQD